MLERGSEGVGFWERGRGRGSQLCGGASARSTLLGRLCMARSAHGILRGNSVGGARLSGSNWLSVDNWPLVTSSSREAKLAQTAETCPCVVCLPSLLSAQPLVSVP